MAKWTPTPEWEGQDSYIIGGGSSLCRFDFPSLKGRNTIGVNDAFRLGPEIVKVCIFGDDSWFQKTKWDLERFPNRVVSVAPGTSTLKANWLCQMDRARDGLYKDGILGWNYSTGACAINLALSLGSRKIFLLGFDMKITGGKSHWHTHRPKLTQEAAFQRHLGGFKTLGKALASWPGVSVVNVSDGTTRLAEFPIITFQRFKEELR